MGVFANDTRGVSQVVGYVLMIAMVITATGITVAIGTQALGGAQSDNDRTAISTNLQSVDAELASLTMVTDASTTSFEIEEEAGRYTKVRQSGSMQINVSGSDTDCSTELPLSSVRYEREGRIIGYEAGGVWERSPGDGSVMRTPPEVTTQDGTLNVNLVNLSGHVDQGENEATLNTTRASATNDAEVDLSGCQRVDEVNVTVQSSFYQAWGDYLESETGGTLHEDSDNETVRVTLGSDQLPRRANYEQNNVINVSTSPKADYMDDVTIHDNSISVDKGADDNTYIVNVKSLQQRPPEVGHVVPLSAGNVTNRTRPPIDVAFVIDESGSMCNSGHCGPGSDSRIENARSAAKVAVGTMNMSDVGDRATVVGYTDYRNQRFVEDQYFSNNSGDVNNTINGLSAVGSTEIASGLNASIAALSVRNESRPGHIILLTDGQNEPWTEKCSAYGFRNLGTCQNHPFWDDRTMNAARIANSKGYTVHTFAYGHSADDDLLRDVADETGGTFNDAGTGDELEDVFAGVVSNITEDRPYVVRTPLSTNFTSSEGGTNAPQMVGDTDSIAKYSDGDSTFLNINDPTAPTLFTHSFAIEGGEKVVINATTYTCEEWEATGQIEKRTVDGETTEYPVARCSEIDDTNESLSDDKITVNVDGDDASWLMTNDEVSESLNDSYVEDGTKTFDLKSNQVVVTFDFPDSESSKNRLSLVYEVGISESEARASDIVNVQMSEVDIE